jgi:hypothetical protein
VRTHRLSNQAAQERSGRTSAQSGAQSGT